MSSDDLTRAQAKVTSQALYPGTNYLVRLRERMEKAGFPPGDKLYQFVCKDCDAARHLGVEVHYMSCDGVGTEGPRLK